MPGRGGLARQRLARKRAPAVHGELHQDALAATRRGLLREPHMPPDHYFRGLSREQAVVVVEQQSELSLLDCDGHLDHRKPLCWGTAQSTDVLQLDNIDLIHRDDNLEKGSLNVRLVQTADGSGVHFERVARRGEPVIHIHPDSPEYQDILRHMDESEAAAACTRQLMDEVGGPDRQCPCGVCAYRRGEALTPRQVAHLDHYVFDDVHRFVVPIVREEVDDEVFPASVVLSLGVLGDAQRFFPASLPQRRDGMLVPGAQRSTHAAASEEEGGGGGQQGGAAAVPARRRLPPNLGELLGRGVAAWAAQLPPSIPQHMRTLMQESALLELRRRFQLAEVVVQEEAEQQQQQRARQRRAPARRQAELSAAEKWRARREQLERAAAALAEIEQLAADGLAAADAATVLRELRQAAQRAYSAILLRMFAVREGYGLWSPEHQRAYGLYLRMQKLAGVPMQLIYSAEEAEECALLRHYLAQGSNKRQRQQ